MSCTPFRSPERDHRQARKPKQHGPPEAECCVWTTDRSRQASLFPAFHTFPATVCGVLPNYRLVPRRDQRPVCTLEECYPSLSMSADGARGGPGDEPHRPRLQLRVAARQDPLRPRTITITATPEFHRRIGCELAWLPEPSRATNSYSGRIISRPPR